MEIEKMFITHPLWEAARCKPWVASFCLNSPLAWVPLGMPSRSPCGETGGYIPPQTVPAAPDRASRIAETGCQPMADPSLSRESSSLLSADRSGRPIISEPPHLSLTPPAQRDYHPSSRSSPHVGNKAGSPSPPRIHVSRLSPRRALGSPLTHQSDPSTPKSHNNGLVLPFTTTIPDTMPSVMACRRCMSSRTRVSARADLPTLASHRCSASPDGGCAACCSDEDHESTTEGHKGRIMIVPGISGTLSLYKDHHVSPLLLSLEPVFEPSP